MGEFWFKACLVLFPILSSQLKISAAECNDLKFCLCFSAAEGEVMKEFYNENGKHKETKYYYGKTSESKWRKKCGDLIIVNMGTWLFVCLFGLSFTVIDSMKSVLKKTKGSDILKEIEEPAVKSNPLARGKKNVDICCW